jgi:hypothetical protein
MHNPGRTFGRRELLSSVWPKENNNCRVVSVYIYLLLKRLRLIRPNRCVSSRAGKMATCLLVRTALLTTAPIRCPTHADPRELCGSPSCYAGCCRRPPIWQLNPAPKVWKIHFKYNCPRLKNFQDSKDSKLSESRIRSCVRAFAKRDITVRAGQSRTPAISR